jgi:DNA replication factor GINS
MNLEDLRAAQTRERATDGLQDLRDSFYVDVAEYIQELKDQRETAAAAASDPFGDPEVQELTDKIETAEQVAEAIYERRMGKLVKQASLAAAGMPDDANGLTDEERALYGDLVDRIESNKAHVLDVISGDADPGSTDQQATEDAAAPGSGDSDADPFGDASDSPSPTDPPDEQGDASAAAAMGGGLDSDKSDAASASETGADDPPAADQNADSGGLAADSESADAIAADLAAVRGSDSHDEDEGADADDVERTTVRVTDDVGEIFGLDEREYDLEAEDVVTLPAENAKPLVEKDAAEKLE